MRPRPQTSTLGSVHYVPPRRSSYLNGTNYTVTAADLANGYITATLEAPAAKPLNSPIQIQDHAVDAQGHVDVA
ncbi:hypothetical protein ABTD34_18440, partial [Acinetobacter baumannii]